MTRSNTEFDPYRKWLGIPKERQPPNFYELLAITLDEDDPDVIHAAIEQRRRFIESKRGEGKEAAVKELLYQISEAEMTLLDPVMRRDYDRRVGLFEKRRRKRQFDPHAPRTRFKSRPGKAVGEDPGTMRLFAGIMAVLVLGCGVIALMSGMLPWGKPSEKVNAATVPAVADTIAPAANIIAPGTTPEVTATSDVSPAVTGVSPISLAQTVEHDAAAKKRNQAGISSSGGNELTGSEWQSLFSGTDLTGWRFIIPPKVGKQSEVSRCWTVDKDRRVLVAHGSQTYWTHWLETEEQFGDFILLLEWRFPPKGTIDSNGSGIVIRSSGFDRNDRNPRGVEIDFRPAHAEDGRMGTGCFLSYEVPISNRAGTAGPGGMLLVRDKAPGPTAADGWSTCEITCRGDRVTVVMNGEQVNEGWGLKQPRGTICLRSQKSNVEFRNVRVHRLSEAHGQSADAPTATSSAVSFARDRIGGRNFPSIFQAWASADNLPSEERLATLARHDLVWNVAQFFLLKWDRHPIGLADGFTPQSTAEGLAFREQALAKNPRMVLLAEIRYRDAPRDYLPEGHEWWMRDEVGRKVSGWRERLSPARPPQLGVPPPRRGSVPGGLG